jgi:hypothetical protein
LQFELYS